MQSFTILKEKSALFALLLSLFFCLFISINFRDKESTYGTDYKEAHYSYYDLMAKSFLQGQIILIPENVNVEKEISLLKRLNNPYSIEERKNAGCDIWGTWDLAYYNGNFFSTFGLSPVILMYLPYRIIAGKALPEANAALSLAIFGVVGLYILAKNAFDSKVETLFILSAPFLTYLYYYQSNVDFYYISVLFPLVFLIWHIALMFSIHKEKTFNVRLKLFFASLCIGLAAMVRPSGAIAVCLFLIPLYIKIYNEKIKKNKSLLLFLLPCIVCGVVLALYNYKCFGSVFEFGKQYHLTGYDMRNFKLRVGFSELLDCIYSYFCNYTWQKNFPFIDNSIKYSRWSNPFIYREIACLPLCIFPIFLIWFLPKKARENNLTTSMIKSSFISSLFVAYIDYCMSGVDGRYIGDFCIPIVISTFFIIEKYISNKTVMKFILFLIVISMVAGFLMLFASERNYAFYNNVEFYDGFKHIFTFGGIIS